MGVGNKNLSHIIAFRRILARTFVRLGWHGGGG